MPVNGAKRECARDENARRSAATCKIRVERRVDRYARERKRQKITQTMMLRVANAYVASSATRDDKRKRGPQTRR